MSTKAISALGLEWMNKYLQILRWKSSLRMWSPLGYFRMWYFGDFIGLLTGCVYVRFPLRDLHPNQSERGTEWGHWRCLCLHECRVFLSVLICVASCVYVYICFTHVFARLLVENTCSALLPVGPWGTELHQPHLYCADAAPNIFI